MELKPVIGLEIHCQLLTRTKLFCSCPTDYVGREPNTIVCPVCLGLPGSLPVLNKEALKLALRAAIALNCNILRKTRFHRKNYFYPDLPKAYQISQYDIPLGVHGYLEVNGKKVRIRRIHMEEDAGKLVHPTKTGRLEGAQYSLVDFNRCGVPLIEIVTEPDISSPEEAKAFVMELRSLVQHIGVSDGNMEEGSLRCDANISISVDGKWGTKTEIKNMNSFKAIERALAYEIRRQIDTILSGGEVVQETRHWDDSRGITTSLRGKEEAHDYRYFPEPDLLPLTITDELISEIRATMPELPKARRERWKRDYGLGDYEVSVLSSSKPLGDLFDTCVREIGRPKEVSNWLQVEFLRIVDELNLRIEESVFVVPYLKEILELLDNGVINAQIAKSVFEEAVRLRRFPHEIVKSKGLEQVSDESAIREAVKSVLAENQDAVHSYLSGKDKAFNFLLGQVMRVTKGKANPAVVRKVLEEELKALS
ncbi:MAG: Asp-tRNA(Asn)/Glu-tRNA(Gln) amidotransferase subunit GatB [Synergistetes bacterium]|nr:Asp-tRNA(Asn)/Glu-tRNA(Gln) amidotransferase subunit GatB [Synergistota bacterium]MCX8127684.1 Asp-tRNA(Asn)/Glu-tRNA(Gln) amidotransferase subunit GatB [Synergistota bacterium]MDW8191401.1 Asp-tRNA(Asn)/Glu-tRNA(Gln) amidotransferase subunit GatB [Synergistota bacterium]